MREMGERMKGGAVREERSPETDAMLLGAWCGLVWARRGGWGGGGGRGLGGGGAPEKQRMYNVPMEQWLLTRHVVLNLK